MFRLSKNTLISSLRFAVVSFVVSLALILPGLSLAGLQGFYLQSLVPAIVLIATFSLTKVFKPLIRTAIRFVVLIFLLFSYGITQALPNIINALVSGSMVQGTVMLFSDILLPFWGIVCSLLGLLLTNGEPSFSIAILITVSMTMYLAGHHAYLLDYWPVALSIPLLLSFGDDDHGVPGSGQEQHRVRPLVLVVALMLALSSFALTPKQPVTNPTLKQQAADIRQWMNDTFFFTDQREAFSLKNLGWQPLEDGLGGKPNPVNVPLLEIQGQGSIYLRGTVKDYYTGRSWYDSVSDQRYSYRSLRYAPLRDKAFDAELPAQELRKETQSLNVHVLRQGTSTLLMPQRVRDMSFSERMVPYFNLASELFITRNIEAGDTYTVVYEDYRASGDLLELSKKTQDTVPLSEDAYLQLPNHLVGESIVRDLANKITAGAQTPYKKAAAIQQYLQTNYRFTQDVIDAPSDTDFVAHFLFETKQGYCTYFASGMTILCRLAGLPARYVEGFQGSMEANQPTILTGLDAHAWTEVNIPGIGWVTFDAAAPSENQGDSPQGSSENEQNTPSPKPEQSPPPEEEEQDSPSSPPETPTPPPEDPLSSPTPPPSPKTDTGTESQSPPASSWWLWLLLLLVVARWLWVSPAIRTLILKKPNAILRLWYTGCLETVIMVGQKPSPSETMVDFALRTHSLDTDWLELSHVVSAMQYGKRHATFSDITLARNLYQRLYNNLSAMQKLFLHLKRLLPKPAKALKALKNLRK